MKFHEMCEIEPKLQQLADEAERFVAETVDDGNVCANAKWYGYAGYEATGLKDRLVQLVGWEASKAELRTIDAYDVAYQHVYNLLPDCRGACACSGIMRALVG